MYQNYNGNKPWCVYLYHNISQNSYYCGISANVIRRMVEHHIPLPPYPKQFKWPKPLFGTNAGVQESFEAQDEIEFTIMEICNTKSDAMVAETWYIQTFKNMGYKLFNRTAGGYYDKDPSVKFVDISQYKQRQPMDLQRAHDMLYDEHAADLVLGKQVKCPNEIQTLLVRQLGVQRKRRD